MSDAVELAEVPQLFEHWLAGRPLADRSRREYARNVRAYCAWLAATPDRDGWQGDPLSDPLARDHAARDFRRYLQVERRAAASTVNLALASLDALYRCLGLGRPHVRRDKPALAAPRALDEAAQRRLLRAAAVARTSGDRYRLISRPGVLSDDEQLRLRAARGRADRNLTVPEANVLRVLLGQPNASATHATFTDPEEQDAVAALLRAGTLLEFDHVVSIHEDVAFSLFNRYRPPQSVVSPSCRERVSSR